MYDLSDELTEMNNVRNGVLIVGILIVELGEFEVGLPHELNIFVGETAGILFSHSILLHLSIINL